MNPDRAAVTDEGIDRRLAVLAAVLLVGAVAALLDTTIVTVAVGDIGRSLRAPVSSVHWVTAAYLLAMAAVIPTMGWLVDRFGARRVWIGAITVFLVGSLLCTVAWSVVSLSVFRVVQGLGGGLVLPLVQAILVREAGPDRVGRVMALVGIPGNLAPILGPVLGGVILSTLHWRWIFLVNLPVCVVAIALAIRHVPRDAPPATTQRGADRTGLDPTTTDRKAIDRTGIDRLDRWGLALAVPGVVGLVSGLSTIGRSGSASTTAWLSTLGGAALLAAFVRHARGRGDRALLDVRLFAVPSFSAGATLMFLFGVALYGPMLLLPLYFQQVSGHDVGAVGWLLAPQGLGTIAALWLAGRAIDTVGPRPVALTAIVLTTAGSAVFAVATPSTASSTLLIALFVRGLGLGAVGVATMGGAYRGVEPHAVARATSLLNVVQRIGAAAATALLAALLQHRLGRLPASSNAEQVAGAYRHVFGWTTAFTVVAAPPARALPGRPDARTDRRNRHAGSDR